MGCGEGHFAGGCWRAVCYVPLVQGVFNRFWVVTKTYEPRAIWHGLYGKIFKPRE